MNEKIIDESIENYRKKMGNITILIIAHRLSTIKNADKIVVIKNGVLTEIGDHQTLLMTYPNGIYSGFVSKQASSEEESPVVDEAEEVEEEAPAGGIKRAKTRTKSIKGADGKIQLIKESLNPEEVTKLEIADDADEEQEKKNKEVLEKLNAERSIGKRLLDMNEPKILILFGCLGSIVVGGT